MMMKMTATAMATVLPSEMALLLAAAAEMAKAQGGGLSNWNQVVQARPV